MTERKSRGRRVTDHGWGRRLIRENFYRDIWLLLITIVVGLTVWSASMEANRAHGLAQAIQRQRVDSIQLACRAQNRRHHATITALDYVLARAELHARPARARQLRASRRFTVLLIDALAPVQDCRRIVALATRLPRK